VTFSVKPGVDLSDVHPELVRAWPVIMDTYAAFGIDNVTLTSGRDGEHMQGSFHYLTPMRANDFRTWADDHGTQLRWSVKERLAEELQRELGPRFTVVPERTHMHIQFEG
jgi:hypothetical protein